MNQNSERPQPGWYPTPSGEHRYWDGTTWLDLPDPAALRDTRTAKKQRRGRWVGAGILAAILLIGGGTFAAMSIADSRAERIAAEAEREAAQEAAAAEKEAEAAAEAEAEELARQEAADQAEVDRREAAVSEIEDAVAEMAEGHIDDGLVDGPILEVACSPVAGGSLDDLAQQTTVFECFVANEELSGGRYSGYYYNATMNWGTESFTYGIGQP